MVTHVYVSAPATVKFVRYDGRLGVPVAIVYPSAPYTPSQFPCVVVSTPPDAAWFPETDGLTTNVTVPVAFVYCAVFDGVNVTDSVWLPTPSTVPSAGVYAYVPATADPLNVAVAFSCVALNAVPCVIGDGVAHVITGALWFVTTSVTVPVAVV